jgi:hypothetical protein
MPVVNVRKMLRHISLAFGTQDAFVRADKPKTMRLHVNVRMLYRHAATSAVFIAATGCGDGPTAIEPNLQLTQTSAAARNGVKPSALVKRNGSLKSNVSASAEVTPEGGFVALPQAGLFLYIPPGALSQTTVITATALKGNRIAYDFQPHGLTFNTPVYIAQATQDTELDTSNDTKKRPDVWGGYLRRGSADILPDGRATFSEVFDAFYQGTGNETLVIFGTSHFSGYGLVSGMKPLVQAAE